MNGRLKMYEKNISLRFRGRQIQVYHPSPVLFLHIPASYPTRDVHIRIEVCRFGGVLRLVEVVRHREENLRSHAVRVIVVEEKE